jgi:hypothetical protein
MKGKPRGLLLLAVIALLVVAAAVPAYAQLTAVSPGVDPDTGYPSWYEDNNGTRLQLCLTADECLGGNNLIDEATGEPILDNDGQPCDPNKPDVATGCLPEEAFYAVARAETSLNNTNGRARIRWRAVLEGAFANEAVQDGDQIVFTRVQVTGSKIPLNVYPAGTNLTFRTPYGELSAQVTNKGTVNRARTESDPGDVANGFRPPVTETQTGFGPSFLTWNTFGTTSPDAPPDGFIGDPLELHAIKGGDNNVNSFQVFRGGNAVSPLVREFEVAGQVAPQ